MMATSVLLGVEARLAKTDAMLLLCCVAAMGVMARLPSRRARARDLGWAMPADLLDRARGGILLKGPLILMVVGLDGALRAVHGPFGALAHAAAPGHRVLWMLVLVLPWFIAIMRRAGESFLQDSVGQDLLGKMFQGQETHGAPPGYYLVLFWLTFWPAAPLAAVAAPAVWRHRREAATRFLLAWLVPSWIVFELVVTKLPHYVLPLYPAIAILIAREIERRDLSDNPHLVRTTVMWPIFAALLPVLGIGLLIYLRGQFGWLAWPFAAGAAIFGFYAWRLYDVEGAERSFVRASIGALLLFIAVLGVAVPLMRPIFPSRDARRMVTDVPAAAIQWWPPPAITNRAWFFSPARAPASSTDRPPPRFSNRAAAASPSSRRATTARSHSAPRRSDCAIACAGDWRTASTPMADARSPLRSIARSRSRDVSCRYRQGGRRPGSVRRAAANLAAWLALIGARAVL